jgi:hypothetical protein
MKAQKVYENKEFDYDIVLKQTGKDRFTVLYGMQVDSGLDYCEAAAKIGQAILHALCCQGKMDND